MTDADDMLFAVLTRLKGIDNALQSALVLLDSIAADVHSNTQTPTHPSEPQVLTQNDIADLKALIQRQYETSRQQAATTDRLVRIVEMLMQQKVARALSEMPEARSKLLDSGTARRNRGDRNSLND